MYLGHIILRDIFQKFNEKVLFENINLNIAKGETFAIRGRSGVGKSTLLNIIAGLEKPTSGCYWLDGVKMDELNLNKLSDIRKKKMGYISQYSPMIPKLKVIENIMVPYWFEQKSKSEESILKKIKHYGEIFGISHLLYENVDKLSGGEMQRVSIIRSIISEPELIIADEPTGSLDTETALEVLNVFKNCANNGASVIIATHHAMVASLCDKQFQLTKQGLISEWQ